MNSHSKFSPSDLFVSDKKSLAYKKLDLHYQKKLDFNFGRSIEQIDERHFLKNRINANLDNLRFTPFGCKVALNSNAKNTKNLSFRVLDYEGNADNSKTIEDNKQHDNNCIKLIKRFKEMPTPNTPKMLLKATPMTQAMQVYNWLFEKSKFFPITKEDRTYI
eukprot:GHVR01050825.1.p1 GENE.GHVR01050825.1~~GHVR01050825.1.p1  ORF type:complete len:162 (+),score=6.78 GHVR01050825.1:2152-2637(+)